MRISGSTEVGNLEAAEGFQVVATQNPKEFVGTSLISEALRDRFELLTLDYQTFEEEESIVAQLTGLKDTLLIQRGRVHYPEHPVSSACPQRCERRAAASLALIAANLGGKDFLNRAAELALPTRIEFKEDLEGDQRASLSQFLEDVVKKKALRLERSSGLRIAIPRPEDEEQRPAFPTPEQEGMFPSGAMFLCPDWKATRLSGPRWSRQCRRFRRIALPQAAEPAGKYFRGPFDQDTHSDGSLWNLGEPARRNWPWRPRWNGLCPALNPAGPCNRGGGFGGRTSWSGRGLSRP